MDNIVRRIYLFHKCLRICWFGMSICFAVSLFLFFKYDIRNICRLFWGKDVQNKKTKKQECYSNSWETGTQKLGEGTVNL